MAKSQKQDFYDDADDDFLDVELEDDPYEASFSETKVAVKRHREKSKRDARHRLEDYFERKALKLQQDDWNFDDDFDYEY